MIFASLAAARRRRPHAAAALALALMLAVPAAAHAGGVYIAGQGMSLEQALDKALADNPGGTRDAFWVVVSGDQVGQLTRKGAAAAIRTRLKAAFERGGETYACRSDLTRAGIREDELLEGVVAMYGYSERDWAGLLPARKEGIALPKDMTQSQLILKTCAGASNAGN